MQQNLGFETVQVTRVEHQYEQIQRDDVVQEYPIALVYNGISHVVMMATPINLIEFANGFSLSEGIIHNLSEMYAIEIQQHDYGFQIEMEISAKAFMLLKQQRRMMVGRTGCGLCGVESLKQFQQPIPKISHLLNDSFLKQIPSAFRELASRQEITKKTGGAHAAAWVEQGQIKAVFEDVGRHNALDKLLGFIVVQGFDVSKGFVVMTSRASYELIRKCAALNIVLLATISAPTSMAITLAHSAGLTLASFCREDGYVVYSG